MAPPGFAPPSYSFKDMGPPSRAKIAPPPGADTNTRAYVIFFSYLGTCILLTLYVISKLLKTYTVLAKSRTARPPPTKHVLLFVALAAGSLLTTWYYMVQYFNVSYQTWLMWRSFYELDDHQRHWGLWLKETSLFKEAWLIAIVGNARYWWTHQIFFFACGLGLVLEQKGIPRNIKHTWVFMLIGQIVAISFATNLFLLSVLLSPPAVTAAPSGGIRKTKWIGPWLVNFIAIVATETSAYMLKDEDYWDTKDFMPVLLTPHIALLILPFARGLLPAKYSSDENIDSVETIYKYLWNLTIFGGAFTWLRVTMTAYNYAGLYGIYSALTEHPAVSSVGFDVIFCWITWLVWWRLQRHGTDNVQSFEKELDEVSWEGTGTTIATGDNGSAVRRR